MKLAAISIVMLMVLTACETFDRVWQTAAESDIAIRAGTAEYIGRDAERADRVVEWVDDAIESLDAEDEVLLTRIQAEASKRIPWDRLSPGQAILANELLYRVEAKIHHQIDAGVLSEDAVANIVHVLQTIRRQALTEKERALSMEEHLRDMLMSSA